MPNDGWSWFIRRYTGYVNAVLRNAGLRSEDATTAAEEFWSYLYSSRAVERADPHCRFRSFLSGIVRNYAKSWRREHKRNGSVDAADGTLEAVHDVRDEVDIELWAAQVLHLGLARLARSHANDERVLRLFYGLPAEVGGDSQPPLRATEIANRLGATPNTVYQMLFRARHRLRQCIEKEIATTVDNSPDLVDERRLLLGAVVRTRPGLLDVDDGRP
ncbi:MAG TPA: sigma-70 family RNA polymerase sigma factor [Planctomycetota bacterium]